MLLFVSSKELCPPQILFWRGEYRIISWTGTLAGSISNLELRPGRRGIRKIFALFDYLHCAGTENGQQSGDM